MNNKQRKELFKEFNEMEKKVKDLKLQRKMLASIDEGSNTYLAGYYDGLIDVHARRCILILDQLEYKKETQ